ncbi:MAG: methyltransferase family protein [Deltaproteobacteria bacterium]
MKRRIGINALTMVLALVFCARFPFLLIRRTSGNLDDFTEVCGLALILLGQLLRISARGYKAEHSKNSHALVTSGPYSLVRNPMYLGIILIGTGVVFALGRPWAILLFAAGFSFRYFYLFRDEEKALLGYFGKAYTEYKSMVPRIFPSIKSLLFGDVRRFLPLKKEWFKSEIPAILSVLGAVLAVECWEEFSMSGWEPALTDVVVFCAVFAIFLALVTYLWSNNAKIPGNCRSKV